MSAPKPFKVSKKVSKPLTIEQCMDLLIREASITLRSATIHGCEEARSREDVLKREADEWKRLRVHHLEETNFLFDIIRELVKRNDLLDEQLTNVIVDGNAKDD
jgi:hypothetical protein